MSYEIEPNSRVRFAEVAEALDISTDCIMAAIDQGDWWWVLYTETPETEAEDWIHLAVLHRDNRHILQIREERVVIQMGDFQGDYEALMRRAAGD
jgi:hypothetical protein